jgi:hypothetical protein
MKEACVVYMSMGPWLFAVNNLTIDLSTIRETIRRRQTPSGHRSAHALAYTSSLTTNLASYQKKKKTQLSEYWLIAWNQAYFPFGTSGLGKVTLSLVLTFDNLLQ